jgi:hypothetical protein
MSDVGQHLLRRLDWRFAKSLAELQRLTSYQMLVVPMLASVWTALRLANHIMTTLLPISRQ